MKAATICQNTRYRQTASPFPNAATRRYFWERALDAALAAGITVAVVAILLFLLAIG